MRTPEAAEIAMWDDPEEQAKPYSAVQLFLESTRRVQSNFTLTRENVNSVIKICQLVQGMPLGLELAAAWVELLPPSEIAAEITRSLDFLETNQVDVPDRQRSIRAVFDSSWKSLSEIEQRTFLSLCVFVGSFSRESAQQVSQASLRTLLGLANKSWLQQTVGGRFQLHELMRQYGEELLKTNESAWREAKDRHAEYFAGFVSEQSLRMRSPEQIAGLKSLAEEFDGNIKIAWDWLVSEQRWNEIIESMLLGVFQYGEIRWQIYELIPWLRAARVISAHENTSEGRLAFAIFSTLEVYCEESAQILDADPVSRLGSIWEMVNQHGLAEEMGMWYVMLASLARNRNIAIDVTAQIEANITHLREQNLQWQLGISLFFYGWMSDYEQNEASLLEAAKVFADLGVICERGIVAEILGKFSYHQRRPLAEVTGYYSLARQFYQKLEGYSSRTGINLLGLADFYFRQGKYEQGFALFKDEQRELERMGQIRRLEATLHWEGLFAYRYSSYEHALRLRQHSLGMIRKLGSQSDLAWRLFELGEVHRIFGEPEKALDFYNQALPMFQKMNMSLALGFDQRARGDLALDEKRYSDALVHYHKFDAYVREDNHLWGMAQSQGRIALTLAYLGEPEQARKEMGSALARAYEYREDDLALQTLLAEAVCRLQGKNIEAAIELVSFLQDHPGSWNETKQQANGIFKIAAHNLTPETVLAAVERGKGLEFDSVVKELIREEK